MSLHRASFPTRNQETTPPKLFYSLILPKVMAYPLYLLGATPPHALLSRVGIFILLLSCFCSEGNSLVRGCLVSFYYHWCSSSQSPKFRSQIETMYFLKAANSCVSPKAAFSTERSRDPFGTVKMERQIGLGKLWGTANTEYRARGSEGVGKQEFRVTA